MIISQLIFATIVWLGVAWLATISIIAAVLTNQSARQMEETFSEFAQRWDKV